MYQSPLPWLFLMFVLSWSWLTEVPLSGFLSPLDMSPIQFLVCSTTEYSGLDLCLYPRLEVNWLSEDVWSLSMKTGILAETVCPRFSHCWVSSMFFRQGDWWGVGRAWFFFINQKPKSIASGFFCTSMLLSPPPTLKTLILITCLCIFRKMFSPPCNTHTGVSEL